MAIGNVQNYLDSLSVLATSAVQQTSSAETAAQTVTNTTDSDGDSYVSTITGADTVYPSENYNGILKTIASAKLQESDSATTTTTDSTEETESTQGASGSGGGSGDSDSEDETTTEIVTINGVTYLETTTTSNGVTTTTRTVISGEEQ